MYCIVEDTYRQVSHLFPRPGPASRCSDQELMSMCLIGECKGWDTELTLLSEWSHHRDLFPHLPSQSRFNRRRRGLMYASTLIRQVVLRVLDVAQDRQCCIDSLPVPVVQFHLAPQASREWAANEATFGRVSSKKQTIFGYKMQLLVTLGGVILDFVLVSANIGDLQGGYELLEEHTDLDAVADKGYVSRPVADALLEGNRICLMTVPRANQRRQLPAGGGRMHQPREADYRDGEWPVGRAILDTDQPRPHLLGLVYPFVYQAYCSYSCASISIVY